MDDGASMVTVNGYFQVVTGKVRVWGGKVRVWVY